MSQPYSELLALIEVARERSFTRAAANLGMSQSMLSHTIQKMESRLGVRLLTRTTRHVGVTEAGERLLAVATPRFARIETELRALAESGSLPRGGVRFVADEHAVDTVLWPRLAAILPAYPAVQVAFDHGEMAGTATPGWQTLSVQWGGLAEAGQAVRIGPDVRFAVVGAPTYLQMHPAPLSPEDLRQHEGLLVRGSPHRAPGCWGFRRGHEERDVEMRARMVFESVSRALDAAIAGFGLAYLPEDLVRAPVAAGLLLPVLEPWWRTFPGYHLVHASDRTLTPVIQVMIDALRIS